MGRTLEFVVSGRNSSSPLCVQSGVVSFLFRKKFSGVIPYAGISVVGRPWSCIKYARSGAPSSRGATAVDRNLKREMNGIFRNSATNLQTDAKNLFGQSLSRDANFTS